MKTRNSLFSSSITVAFLIAIYVFLWLSNDDPFHNNIIFYCLKFPHDKKYVLFVIWPLFKRLYSPLVVKINCIFPIEMTCRTYNTIKLLVLNRKWIKESLLCVVSVCFENKTCCRFFVSDCFSVSFFSSPLLVICLFVLV